MKNKADDVTKYLKMLSRTENSRKERRTGEREKITREPNIRCVLTFEAVWVGVAPRGVGKTRNDDGKTRMGKRVGFYKILRVYPPVMTYICGILARPSTALSLDDLPCLSKSWNPRYNPQPYLCYPDTHPPYHRPLSSFFPSHAAAPYQSCVRPGLMDSKPNHTVTHSSSN
ncbi:hypothetical protein E2C01_058055 [Portunus trituberculatus]|uniref:Uncharacterized protein n=1 Tax=Portunus trituberculatus TaxID=210409 RepID=A0A5B7H3N1_PORTR|nr:hypothetical protein [Portunus trituberculatus]